MNTPRPFHIALRAFLAAFPWGIPKRALPKTLHTKVAILTEALDLEETAWTTREREHTDQLMALRAARQPIVGPALRLTFTSDGRAVVHCIDTLGKSCVVMVERGEALEPRLRGIFGELLLGAEATLAQSYAARMEALAERKAEEAATPATLTLDMLGL